jgi:hypothetical protein
MSYKIANDGLGQALRTVQRLAQPEVVTLRFKDNSLTVKGAGQNGGACKIKLDVESDGDKSGEVTVDLNLLASVIDKRKDLELTVGEATLVVKSKGFTVDMISMDGQPIEVVPKEILQGSEGIELGSKLMTQLLRYLPKIELRPLLSTYSECPVGIKTNDKGTFVACFDFVQSAFVRLKSIKSDTPFEFVLPSIAQFNTLARELSGHKYKLVITETTLYAFNDMVQAALALPQQEGEQLQLADVIGLVKSLKEMKYKRLVFKTEAVKQFLSNSRAVYDKDSLFTIKAKGDKAKIELKATVGNTSMVTKLKEPVKDFELKCDLNFFASIVNKTNDKTLTLEATPELLLLKEGKISYLMSLV